MTLFEIITTFGGMLMAVIGFFLKQTMEQIKTIKEVTYRNTTEIQVIKNDYLNKIDALNGKFDLLAETIKELNYNIKHLNNKIK